MVRVNLIDPLYLTDQHLLAEHNEILMLISYLRRYPLTQGQFIQPRFVLGRGHMLFFKDKVLYLKKRHDSIRNEMRRRGYISRKVVSIDGLPNIMLHDWSPDESDVSIIKTRLMDKIRAKPDLYTYYRRRLDVNILLQMIEHATWH